MKRFLVFAWNRLSYNSYGVGPKGGMDDFVGSFECLQDIIDSKEFAWFTKQSDVQIFDSQTNDKFHLYGNFHLKDEIKKLII